MSVIAIAYLSFTNQTFTDAWILPNTFMVMIATNDTLYRQRRSQGGAQALPTWCCAPPRCSSESSKIATVTLLSKELVTI